MPGEQTFQGSSGVCREFYLWTAPTLKVPVLTSSFSLSVPSICEKLLKKYQC